jgi:hypothetical protein
MVDIAHEEFVCYKFIHNVFAVMAFAEAVAKDMVNPKREVTSDYLMYLHFEAFQRKLAIMLDDPAMMDAFRRRYPTRQDLLVLAQQQMLALARLHSVRQELIAHHVAPCGTDVHCHKADLEKPVEMTEADHADSLGLNVDQLQAWKTQVDAHGHVHLTQTERDTLRDAILAEFSNL